MYKEGTDIIFHAAGITGIGLFKAAREMNRRAIVVDINQSSQAPGLVLNSMIKNVDEAVLESVRAYVRKYFSGGFKTFGLKKRY
jgi:basic membrane protein A